MNTLNFIDCSNQTLQKPTIQFQVHSTKASYNHENTINKNPKSDKQELKRSIGIVSNMDSWSEEEGFCLLAKLFSTNYASWEEIARSVVTKSAEQCRRKWKKFVKESENDLCRNIMKSNCTEEEIAYCFPWLNIKEISKEKGTKQVRHEPEHSIMFESACTRDSNNNSKASKRYTWTTLEECLLFRIYTKRRNEWPSILPKLLGKSQNSIKQKFYSSLKSMKSYLSNTYGKDSLEYLSQEKVISIIYSRLKIKLMRESSITSIEDFDRLEDKLSALDSKQKIGCWDNNNKNLYKDLDFDEYFKSQIFKPPFEVNSKERCSNTLSDIKLTSNVNEANPESLITSYDRSKVLLPKVRSFVSLSTNTTFTFKDRSSPNTCRDLTGSVERKHTIDDLPLNENLTLKTDFMSYYSGDNLSLCEEASENNFNLSYLTKFVDSQEYHSDITEPRYREREYSRLPEDYSIYPDSLSSFKKFPETTLFTSLH